MVVMDYLPPEAPISAAAKLWMPFSDPVKYLILGISIALLLLALGILTWQVFRCYTQTHKADSKQDIGGSQNAILKNQQ